MDQTNCNLYARPSKISCLKRFYSGVNWVVVQGWLLRIFFWGFILSALIVKVCACK